MEPCRACGVYTESWATECCYCERVYGTSKRNWNEEFRNLWGRLGIAKRDPSQKENLEASIKPVLDLISNCYSQLKYSSNILHIKALADQDDYMAVLVDFFSSVFPVGDETVEQSFASIPEGTVTTFQVLKDFMAKHGDAKQYFFQIKKCSDETRIYCSINPV